MQRLGRNRDRYEGVTIAIADVLHGIVSAARRHGWRHETLEPHGAHDITVLHRPAGPGGEGPAPRIYLSAGIHGDEPAGPLALRELLDRDLLPRDADCWIVPCLNPTGFPRNTRTSAQDVDLNRDYRNPRSRETRAHIAWLERQPEFDVTFCLHEDWEASGFYVYELNPDRRPSLARPMLDAVTAVCPIDLSPQIDGRDADRGLIHPTVDPALRPEWPEAFYLLQHKTRLSYTLEAPSDFELEVRVAALVTSVQAALRAHRPKSALDR